MIIMYIPEPAKSDFFVKSSIQTGLPQEEAVKQIKERAHAHGFSYRSRKLKSGVTSLTIKRKEEKK